MWLALGGAGWVGPEPGILLGNAALAAVPFVVLWLVARTASSFQAGAARAAKIGLAVTTAAWVWAFIDGYHAQTTIDSGGANIGLGLVLLALPVVLSVGMLAVARFARR